MHYMTFILLSFSELRERDREQGARARTVVAHMPKKLPGPLSGSQTAGDRLLLERGGAYRSFES